ncbi:MAG: glutathione synthase [Desulfobacteraceae bacterium]|nr:MAG: glutathione synthase [Desulfobacteraceae bacterium]
MILSFHPMITADQNMICAGRDPGDMELDAMRKADAVILPQGCRQTLYDMAAAHCAHVFPNYAAKFTYPGKLGQIELFAHFHLPHPKTETFTRVDTFYASGGTTDNTGYPLVFKFDWGGEGDTVMRMDSPEEFNAVLEKAKTYEKTGQSGFLIQEYIPSGNRSLRVAVIGGQRIAYWRIQKNPNQFGTALSKNASIDAHADPDKQAAGIALVNQLCEKTGINLAGVDLIFPESSEKADPLLLEINYFFGRTGIGGSKRFYALLRKEVKRWLNGLK